MTTSLITIPTTKLDYRSFSFSRHRPRSYLFRFPNRLSLPSSEMQYTDTAEVAPIWALAFCQLCLFGDTDPSIVLPSHLSSLQCGHESLPFLMGHAYQMPHIVLVVSYTSITLFNLQECFPFSSPFLDFRLFTVFSTRTRFLLLVARHSVLSLLRRLLSHHI